MKFSEFSVLEMFSGLDWNHGSISDNFEEQNLN